MHKTKTKHAELQGPENESVEDAVIRVIQTYERISASMRDSKGRLESMDKLRNDCYRAEVEARSMRDHLSVSNSKHKEEIFYLVQEINRLKFTIDSLKLEKEDLKVESGALAGTDNISLERERNDHKARYEVLLRKSREDAASYSKTVNDLQSQIEQERAHWKAFSNHLHDEKRDHESRLKAAELDFSNRLKDKEDSHEEHMRIERSKFDEQIGELKDCIRVERAGVSSRLTETSDMFERRLQNQDMKHNTEMKDLESKHVHQTGRYQEYLKEKESIVALQEEEIHRLKSTVEDLKSESSRLKEQNASISEAENAKKASFEQHVHRLQTDLDGLHRQMSQSERRFKIENEDRQAVIQQMTLKHKAEIRQRMDAEKRFEKDLVKYEDVIRKLKAQHKIERDRQSSDMETRLKRQQHEHENKAREMKRLLLDIAELRTEVDQQRPNAQIKILTLRDKLGDKPGTDIRELRSVAEEMRTALSRENYKWLKDHHIVARFKAIANEIYLFSRLEWDVHREARWPCSENTLLRLYPQNTRKLKQCIVQSSLWTFLYERIFRSPFCIVGPEGAEVDREWEDIYASCELWYLILTAPD